MFGLLDQSLQMKLSLEETPT